MKTAKEFLAEKKVDNYNHKCGLIYVPKVSALDAMEEYAQYKVNELNKSDVKSNEAIQKNNKRESEEALLKKYSKFLEDSGYLDSDWWQEEPTAIDEFFKQ